jgi:DNA-binding LytR/AlgR family response regulator
LRLLGSFDCAETALTFLETASELPDLVFLDVEMPGLNGMEFLDRSPVLPLIVFTTSSADYALDAFEYNATDFLKKPITMPRFAQCVQRASEAQIQKKQHTEAALERANEVYVREDGRYRRVAFDDILFFENVGDYVKLRTQYGQHTIYGALKSIDEKLQDPRFLKVHRSFIVNLDKIKDIEENSLVIEKSVIPVSRAHKASLLARLRIL